MKNFIPVLIALLLCVSVSAQYKKASFFEKEGRTYELGSRAYFLGDGRGTPVGFSIGFGRDRGGKRFFSAWEIQIIPSYKYSYSTVDENNDPIHRDGRAKTHWIYAVNYGYHLLNNEEPRKVQPYVVAGINIVMAGGVREETETQGYYGYPQRNTAYSAFSAGIHGGLGCLVNLNSTLSLKVQSGYDAQWNVDGEEFMDNTVKPYYMFPSHVYASVALRVRVVRDK